MAHKLEAAFKARQWKKAREKGWRDERDTVNREKYWRRSCNRWKGSRDCQCISLVSVFIFLTASAPALELPPALEGDNNMAVSLDTLNEGRLREISFFFRDLLRPLSFPFPFSFTPSSISSFFRPCRSRDPSSSSSHVSSFLFRSRHASRVRFRPPCIWRAVVTVLSEIIHDTHGTRICHNSPHISFAASFPSLPSLASPLELLLFRRSRYYILFD